jgi:2-oxoglutarate ferredoxin oxidoreductase subunit alpha
MVRLRQKKVERIADDLPPAVVEGPDRGDILVIGWGGTYGAIRTAVENKRREGKSVSHLHLKYLNPFQKNLPDVFKNFKKILIPELNLGQLSHLLQAKYLVPTVSLTKVQGLPFRSVEIEDAIDEIIK